MRTIFAPNTLTVKEEEKTCFLAGSIEGNKAEFWQDELTDRLKEYSDLVLLNPRRNDYDVTAKQDKEDLYFRGQVEWELKALEKADIIYMYLDPNTKSPISLLELGIHCQSGKLIVCCTEGFYRKGNVDITCERYGVPVFDNKEDIFKELLDRLI